MKKTLASQSNSRFPGCYGTALGKVIRAAILILVVAPLPVLVTSVSLAQELPLPAATIDRSEPVDFAKEIAPVLKRNCLACHHAKEAEGGLVLETIAQITKGGDSGPGVVANDVEASMVFVRASGSEEPLMPPEDNTVGAKPLTVEELGLLKLWIEQGATGVDPPSTAPLEFQPIPESLRTIYAMDVSPDGQTLAVSRGNRVVLFDTHGFEPTAQLIDESLGFGPVADVDLIQSMAFAPDGHRIATGGFRTVRIWKKETASFDVASTPLSRASGWVAVSSDGALAAFVNPVDDIEIWNLAERTKQQTLSGHTGRITGLTFASTADRLYSCDDAGKVIAWTVSSGQQIAELDMPASMSSLSTLADGSHVAAIDSTRAVRVFQFTGEGNLVALGEAFQDVADATAVAWTDKPEPTLIISTESAGVLVRKLSDQQAVRTIDHGGPVDAVAVSADQTKLLTAGRDGKARLWNLADGAALLTMQGDVQSNLRVVVATRDAARQKAAIDRANQKTKALQDRLKKETDALAKVNEQQKKSMEALATQEKAIADADAAVKATEGKIAQADADIQAAQAAIEAANKAMADATAMKDAAAKELEGKKKAVADAQAAKQNTVTVIENRKQTIASAEAAKQLAADAIPAHELVVTRQTRRLQQLEKQQVYQQGRLGQPEAAIVSAAFSSDGSRIATAHASGDVRLYRASDGLPLDQFAATPALDRPLVTFAGDLIAGFGANQRAAIWSRQLRWTLERTIGAVDDPAILSDRVTALDFRPDGMSIAAGSGPPSRSGEVKVFAVDTGELVRDFGEIHSDTVLGVEFSPDGRQLASCAADKTIRLLDIAAGAVLRSMEGHTHHVLGIAWQDDLQTIASAGADQTIKLWNVETGQQRRTIAGFGKEITAVTFVATSNQVLSACANGQVRLSNAVDGKAIRNFDAKGDFLYAVVASEDGKRAIAGGHSGTVWIWEIADGKLVAKLE